MPETKRQLHALTLHQPWASLLVAGEKKYETRVDPPPAEAIGRPIAIYANGREVLDTLGAFIEEALQRADLAPDELPLGAIIAIATLHEPFPAEEVARGLVAKAGGDYPHELHLGNFEPEMTAWRFGGWCPIKPVICPGNTGLWQLPLPIIERVREAYRAAGHAKGGMSPT